MTEHTHEDGRPGLEPDDMGSTGSVLATVRDAEQARLLVEELEQEGIPPGAIALPTVLEPEEDTADEEMPESEAFVDVSRSAIAGGAIGALIGGLFGALLTLIVPNLSLLWAIVFGAIFGAGIGGSAGGMAVAKYNSPAWRETYETVDPGPVTVGVHDGDPDVVARAEAIMRRHQGVEVRRVPDGE